MRRSVSNAILAAALVIGMGTIAASQKDIYGKRAAKAGNDGGED